MLARLSDNNLLQKCLDYKTQNPNESFNKIVWNRLPKMVFVGSGVLPLDVYDAVSYFKASAGASASIRTLGKMDISSGDNYGVANRNSEESKKKRRRATRVRKQAIRDQRSKGKGKQTFHSRGKYF